MVVRVGGDGGGEVGCADSILVVMEKTANENMLKEEMVI